MGVVEVLGVGGRLLLCRCFGNKEFEDADERGFLKIFLRLQQDVATRFGIVYSGVLLAKWQTSLPITR